MAETSTFELRWASRAGGGDKTTRQYFDYIVDGKPLSALLSSNRLDLIGRLGWGVLTDQLRSVDRLLLRDTPDLSNNRYMILICPECGDIGCGAITAVIDKTDEHFIWKDFGYENNYEDDMPRLKEFVGIGPFHFDKR